jgi:AraC-like DNA-binding protein
MAQLACFTTRDIAPRERIAFWDAQLWNPVAPFRTESTSAVFEGDACHARLGSIHLFRIAATAHRLECDAAIGRGDRRGLAALVVQRRGNATVSQGGREVLLEPGAWAICDADRFFAIGSADEGEQLLVLLPRERLGIGSCLANHTARNFGDASGTARLLPRYLAGLFDELSAVADSNCSELADMAAQLVRLALFEARQAIPPISMRETLRLRVKDYVRRNLRDPALSIERVAAAFGCTKRHLHKVFTGDEMTLSQFIWVQRLEGCRDALRNPNLARHSITEIAFMWGFNNSAHFSKAFKERFGLPPGSFRGRAADSRALRPLLQAAA